MLLQILLQNKLKLEKTTVSRGFGCVTAKCSILLLSNLCFVQYAQILANNSVIYCAIYTKGIFGAENAQGQIAGIFVPSAGFNYPACGRKTHPIMPWCMGFTN